MQKKKKTEKKFFVSNVITSGNVAINCLCEEGNTYYRQ